MQTCPFDQGFKHYTVPAPKEVPLQCFAMLLGIPFTSENSSLAHLLITCLFDTSASHYSSLWLGGEPVRTSLSHPVPFLGGWAPSLQQKFSFSPKAQDAGTPYAKLYLTSAFWVFHFFSGYTLSSTLDMCLSSLPVQNFISTCIPCWGHWLNMVPRTHPWRSSLRLAHPCQHCVSFLTAFSSPSAGHQVEVSSPPPETARQYLTHCHSQHGWCLPVQVSVTGAHSSVSCIVCNGLHQQLC